MNEQELERSRILARLDRIFEIQNETGDPDEWAECDPDAHNILLDEKRLRTRLAELDAPMIAWADNPQAAEIDALFGRVGELTNREVEVLVIVADCMPNLAWDAVDAGAASLGQLAESAGRLPLNSIEIDGDRYGGGQGSLDFAKVCGEARWCGFALSVRDLLVERAEWDAYDLLTSRWRRAVGRIHARDLGLRPVAGPIHPGDEVLR